MFGLVAWLRNGREPALPSATPAPLPPPPSFLFTLGFHMDPELWKQITYGLLSSMRIAFLFLGNRTKQAGEEEEIFFFFFFSMKIHYCNSSITPSPLCFFTLGWITFGRSNKNVVAVKSWAPGVGSLGPAPYPLSGWGWAWGWTSASLNLPLPPPPPPA